MGINNRSSKIFGPKARKSGISGIINKNSIQENIINIAHVSRKNYPSFKTFKTVKKIKISWLSCLA